MPEDNNSNETTDNTPTDINNPEVTNTSSVGEDDTNEPKPEVLGASPQPGKKKSNKGLLAVIFILLLLAVGAAYWFTQKKDATTNSAKSTETLEIPELRIGNTEGPASVFFPDEGVLGIQTILDKQVYEGIVGWDNKKVVPLIAQSWTNPDQMTWNFKIRPNVKFHTGKAVTANEIKASLDDLKKYDYWSIYVSTIDSIEVKSESELVIKTKEPDALLLNRLAQAFISDLSAPDKLGNNGTGAYHLDSSATNDKLTTTLAPNDEYYLGRPKVRKLVFKLYDNDDAVAAALINNEIEIASTLPIPSVKKLVEGKNYSAVEFDAPGTFGIYMNQLRSANTLLKNKDFRRAIALSVDRQAIIDGVGNKNAPAYQVIPKSLPGHDESISFPKFDLEAAKAALVKSGYKNEPLEVVYIAELQQDPPFAIKQLKAAGFNVKETAYKSDDTDKALDDLRAGKYDIFFAGFMSDVFDARDILGAILSSSEQTYPTLNDEVYDKLLLDSDKEFDPIKRIELLQKANKYIIDNVLWIPLRNSNYVSYSAKDIDIASDFNGGGYIGAYYRKVGRIQQ